MIVRTADSFQFIDPATNTIAATLPKSESARPPTGRGRSTAPCGSATASGSTATTRRRSTRHRDRARLRLRQRARHTDLVIAWSYNEDAGESGTSVAAFIDPATNQSRQRSVCLSTSAKPAVLDNVVFFPGSEGSQSVVVDRATGTITSLPDLGRPFVHSNDSAFDGTSLYVVVEGRDIAIVDPTTFEITGTIEPFDFDPPLGIQVNALALGPDALWVVNDESSILQRFDLGG